MQARTISLSWISFSLKALRLSPFGLVGSGFSLPGTLLVRKSAAWVEFSENVSDKSGCVCCYYEINNCAVPQGCKGRIEPLAQTYYGETKDFCKKQKKHQV